MEEQQKKRRGRPRKNPDDPKWLDKTEFDAEKAWKEQAKVVDKQQTEMVSEALQNAIKGTGKVNNTLTVGEKGCEEMSKLLDADHKKTTIKDKKDAKICMCCLKPEYMVELRHMHTPSVPTSNPNNSALMQIFDPESELDICKDCMPEYLKENGLRLQQPQMIRMYPKVGRNEPCPCGSGKKYKKCHMTEAHDRCVPVDVRNKMLEQQDDQE